MQCTVVDFAKDKIVFNFSDCSREELENKVTLFFASEDYRPGKSEGDKSVFEKGKLWKRIIFGAFSPFHRMNVFITTATDKPGTFGLLLQRASSGFSGGLIGMNQVRKEFTRISENFKQYFKS